MTEILHRRAAADQILSCLLGYIPEAAAIIHTLKLVPPLLEGRET